ncbi:hypothetical protein K1719_018353 [Acacia pycnantha]|nr:hypothetical protein K1719_018353 [Acacia pycnantha]
MRDSSLVGLPFLNRNYCHGRNGGNGSGEWTEEIDYLDELGNVIYQGKGIRSVEPGLDDHVMIGEVKKPFANAVSVAKLVEVIKRWKWGPELENQLDKLQFRIQSLFDEMVSDCTNSRISSFGAYNRVIQHLAKAEKLEVSFCCFKKMKDTGCKIDTETYNSLITLFLNKGLPYKAFEIYESMASTNCSLDGATYELMIPNLAKSGRLDAAFKFFQEMKERNFRPGLNVFASLVDSMGKAGRLDGAMKVYMEMQSFRYRPPPTVFVSLIESYVKYGKLETALRIWDEMKNAGFRPNFGLYTMIIEAHAKSGKLDIAMSAFSDMEKAGFLPTPSTYSRLLEMHAASGQVEHAMKLYNSMTEGHGILCRSCHEAVQFND